MTRALQSTPFQNPEGVAQASHTNTQTWNMNRKVTCESFNIIYMLECKKCPQRYIGTSVRQLKHCLADHRGPSGLTCNKVASQATGAQFNLLGHSLADLSVSILEQTRNSDEEYRYEREKYFIRKFDTFNNGINKEWYRIGEDLVS